MRLEDILKKGLSKEDRDKLIKGHVPRQSCVLLNPPKACEEIEVSINETSIKSE